MLSYQHAYHAGSLADVHKHAVLAWVAAYLTRKNKPLSYIETHAGRGLYDLSSPEARKTGEAASGILRRGVAGWFDTDHPYARARAAIRQRSGEGAYPGSPLIAKELLRQTDRMHLAEMHPREHAALRDAMGRRAHLYAQDGYAMAKAVCPPTPRRGLMLIDPSYEVKAEYAAVASLINLVREKWPVGVLIVWYPILPAGLHEGLAGRLTALSPEGLRHEVRFPRPKEGHGMVGSGLFLVNPPYGLDAELSRLSHCFAGLVRDPDGN